MIAIAVDDEALMLGALVSAIEASPDIMYVHRFSDCEEALEFTRSNSAVSSRTERMIAFLMFAFVGLLNVRIS